MREDPFEDLGYGKLPGKVRDPLPPVIEPAAPPWRLAGMTWHQWAVARGLCRCEDHADA
jgi:hypothetical protein